MDEAAIIDAIRGAFGPLVATGAYGFTDDAAALPAVAAGATRVVTTDIVVEGVDFDLALYPAMYVGHRALAQNLSDLSAMGATPVGFVWSLALSPPWLDVTLAHVRALAEGAARLAGAHGAALFGGDLSRTSGPLVVSITAFGDVRRTPVRRSGARPGDALWLNAPVGGSAAGLRALRARAPATAFEVWLDALPLDAARLVRAHIAPSPAPPDLLDDATAAIDVSDGLALDAHRLARASGVRLELDHLAGALAAGATRDDALHGGEDYSVLFAAPDQPRTGAIRLGRVVEGEGVWEAGAPIAPRGFDHFAGPASGG